MSGAVVWILGRPSSGKTTLAFALRAALRSRGVACCVLDGDDIRALLRPAPGYDEASRLAFYETLGGLSVALCAQELVVIVAATAHRLAYRAAAREGAARYFEVLVDTPLTECEARDAKGLYAAARSGDVERLPGVQEPFERPPAPHVVASGGHDMGAVARIIAMLHPDQGDSVPRRLGRGLRGCVTRGMETGCERGRVRPMTDSSESDQHTSEEQEQTTQAESDAQRDEEQHTEHVSSPPPKPDEAPPPNRTVARVLAFVVVLGLLLALFSSLSGSDRRQQRVVKSTTWSAGQRHDVELTLVAADKLGLSCASKQAFEGKHCAFESTSTAWPGGPGDDKTQIRPYNTTEQDPLMISGLWSEPALAGALPTQRFSVKCSFAVEGKMTKPSVRWSPAGQWINEIIDWPVGTVSGCKLVQAK